VESLINIQLIYNSLPLLLKGLSYSFLISFCACFIGLLGGFGLTFILQSRLKIIRFIGNIYVFLMRGTPMVIQILILFCTLPLLGIHIGQFWCATLAIGMNSIAYMSQIILVGIRSVPLGEIEAAQALGFRENEIYRYIIIPQAFSRIFPSIINECITLIKDSSLAHIIGVGEIMYQAGIIIGKTYDIISIYFIVALLYFLSTSLITLLLYLYEKKTL
jgi:His/Glu/Gln/Arg/opine family amino acid ABC transporter permease subunit